MSENKKIVETPLMRQYFEVKSQHPDALLLFRVGDFYETFGEDAIIASKVLGIVLTKRANGSAQFVELAGFPHHSIETYLPKLVRNGYKVAVCDQLEDPKLTKKIVKRGVTELVTPGIAYSDQLLNQKENNFLCSVYFSQDKGGIAFLDVSTGTFKVAEGTLEYIELLLSNFTPKEVVVQKGYQAGFRERFGDLCYLSAMDEWAFVPEACHEKLKKQFGLHSLKGFGVENLTLGTTAAGAILFYLEQNHNTGVSHLCSISRVDKGSFVWMDKFTFRNLEIFTSAGGSDGVSLLNVIDKCSSAPGARLLRSWLAMPVKEEAEIKRRHDVVDYFVTASPIREQIQERISNVGDLERITSKAAAGKISPREIMQLKRGLEQMEPIQQICLQGNEQPGTVSAKHEADEINTAFEEGARREDQAKESVTSASATGESKVNENVIQNHENQCSALAESGKEITLFDQLYAEINQKILPEPAAAFGKGDIVADGVSAELDELRQIARHGKDFLLHIQQRESERTGIPSLKISYNSVFGYYLEVRNAHKDKVPADWIRKQTLVNAERYITQELKEYEEKILGAEDKIYLLEQQIYAQVVEAIRKEIPAIQKNSNIIARIDCLAGFAQLAAENHYCRPQINNGLELKIEQGRHPVIETLMPAGEEYIANDLYLDNNSQQVIILTGPNMAGKSALLRQTALIVLLAQIGSFVPAKSAVIGLTDKIFTRVGASDNISRGESTFMVEMIETSTILHNLSERSLILLDEIGRGTSTFDGMSIAWAIVEYIHQSKFKAKTLFATHYHELNELENLYPRVKNYHISVKEVDKKVIFLRKLCLGGVAHSFGIHVARMAGMPQQVVESAQRMLNTLESGQEHGTPAKKEGKKKQLTDNLQLSFFQLDDPLLLDIKDKLKAMDMNAMSPLDAFDAIRALKKQIGL
ncbi:MAG: DNA mismatch repair protein MutS [Bacteroidales bacterium]